MTSTLRSTLSRAIPLSPFHRLSLSSSAYRIVAARAASSLQASSSSTSSPALPNSPPKVVHPSPLISDTQHISPEPPKAPKSQRQAPRIRSRKAALTLVCFLSLSLPLSTQAGTFVFWHRRLLLLSSAYMLFSQVQHRNLFASASATRAVQECSITLSMSINQGNLTKWSSRMTSRC